MNEIFNSNTRRYILSLAISIGLWFFVVVILNPESVATVRGIQVIHANYSAIAEADLVLMDDTLSSVSVEIKGPRKLIALLNNQNIKASIDLSVVDNVGEYYIPVDIVTPYADISLTGKTPPTIKVTIDKMVESEYEMIVKVTGEPADGFVTYKSSMGDSKVKVKAPQTIMNLIAKAVVILDVDDKDSTFAVTKNITLLSANDIEISDRNIKITPETTTAESVILRKKRVPIVPILEGGNSSNRTITASVVGETEIDIIGESQIIDEIQFINTNPIDVSKMLASTQIGAVLKIPDGVILSQDITTVNINMEVKNVMQ